MTAGLVAAAFAVPAAAEDTGIFTLGEIQVTAKSIKEEGTGVQTVDKEQIRDYNRETVSRALNLESGITMSNVGPRNESMVFVRGYDLRQVPVYVDGIPIYVPYDGYVDLGRFNTYDLSQIEITKGFSSVLNGPNNFGGAINLISRRPTAKLEGDAGVGTYLNDDFAENGYNAFANVGTNQGTWYAQVGLSYLDKHQYYMSDDFKGVSFIPGNAGRAAQPPGERLNSYNEDYKINLKLGYTPNATDEYAFNYIAQRGEKGVPPYAGDHPASGPTGPRYWQWPYWDKTSYYFLSNTGIGETSYVKTRVYYDQFQNSLYQYTDATYSTLRTGSSAPSFYDDYTYGASVEGGTKIVPSNELKIALHFKDDVHREHIINSSEQRFEDRIYSIGIEDNQKIGERLNIVAGLSYDSSETIQADGVDGTGRPFQTGTADGVNPELGAFYKTSDTGVARVTFSQKTRFPTIKDRYSFRLNSALPNPNLKPERVTHYEVGYADAWRDKAKFDASVFYDDIRDLIQLVNNVFPPPLSAQNQNIGKARYQGFEVGGSVTPFTTLELGANYTYIERKNLSNPTILLTDVPRHKVFAYGQWRFAQSWRFIGSAEYDSQRTSSTDGQRIASEFGIANAKLAWNVVRNTDVELGVNNIFDRNYEYVEGYPEEGRNYFLNLLYKF
ncbi:MAG TPA: TonB-dependent receptor [Burkholderiales bacterium]|nr:TonB-dependent receptor [Burkholderiales bacterium]